MAANLHIETPQFSGHHANTLSGFRIFYKEKIVRQQFTEAAMNFADALSSYRTAAGQPPASTHCCTAMCVPRLNLQIALAGIAAVLAPERLFNLNGWVLCPSIRFE
jgi:hypothetical protein